jgi:hypothetical protein
MKTRGWWLRSPRHLLWAVPLAGLSCGGGDVTPPATTGSLAITTSTTGPEPDGDGYAVSIDDGTETAIPASGTLQRDNVEPGTHSIRLTGIAANCTVAGENPRTISVEAGTTARVDFTITCASLQPTTGTIQITISTTGAEPDPDGYAVSVDQGMSQPIGINTSTTISNVPPGTHAVELTGIADNCDVMHGNPSSVTVVAGAQATVAFGLECPSPTLRWQGMSVPGGYDLYSVWGSSATDVYALGYVEHAEDLGTFLVRYDGNIWSTLAILTDNSSTQGEPKNFYPHDIWSSSPNDVVLVGSNPDRGNAPVVHYDGQTWSAMAVLGLEDPTETGKTFPFLLSVWGTSKSDLFAVGGFADGSGRPLAAHYDGTRWSTMPLPGDGYWLRGVTGVSGHDVYAVGQGSGADFILHYDGSQWAKMPIEYTEEFDIWRIWASSSTDVFAIGDTRILHYDRKSWSRMAAPATATLTDIWGSSGLNVYAVANDETEGLQDAILHYDGKAWTKVADYGGYGIWGSSSRDVFVVGRRGGVAHGTP